MSRSSAILAALGAVIFVLAGVLLILASSSGDQTDASNDAFGVMAFGLAAITAAWAVKLFDDGDREGE